MMVLWPDNTPMDATDDENDNYTRDNGSKDNFMDDVLAYMW